MPPAPRSYNKWPEIVRNHQKLQVVCKKCRNLLFQVVLGDLGALLGGSWGGSSFPVSYGRQAITNEQNAWELFSSHVCVVKCLCLFDGFRITMRRSISQTLYVAMKLSLGALGKFFRGRIVLVSIFQTFYVAMKLSLRALGNFFNNKY